jgi:hypothetical protein
MGVRFRLEQDFRVISDIHDRLIIFCQHLEFSNSKFHITYPTDIHDK